jgi:hypothetical protein
MLAYTVGALLNETLVSSPGQAVQNRDQDDVKGPADAAQTRVR